MVKWLAGRLRSLRSLRPPSLLNDVLPALVIFVALVTGSNGDPDVLPGALLMSVALLYRRRWPLPTFCLAIFGLTIGASLSPWPSIAGAVVAAYSAGAYGGIRVLSLGLILGTCVLVVKLFGGELPRLPDFAGPFVILVPSWLAGSALRNWRLRVEAMQDRAELLRQEGVHATEQALIEERARIAREMHDVVAHGVSVMVVQAGAARKVMPADPAAAEQALLAVEATGRDALHQLRGMLGLLSSDDGENPLEPQPGLSQIEPLLERVRTAGLPVTCRTAGESRPLPAGLDLAAYRVVQEALTNALKHAGGAPTEVSICYRDEDLKIEVIDTGTQAERPAAAGSGRGLLGMRERVALFGGRLEWGPGPAGGYAVRAWLPYAGGET